MTYVLVFWGGIVIGFVMGATWCGFFRQNDEYDEIDRQMVDAEDGN